MKYLRQTTPEMTAPVRELLQKILPTLPKGQTSDVLHVAIEELVPRMRYGTAEWVFSMLMDEEDNARYGGCPAWGEVADQLGRAGEMLCNVLANLDDD